MFIGSIIARMTLVDDFTPTLEAVSLGLNQLGRAQRQWSMNLGLFGAALTASVTLPMQRLIKTAADFESEFANVVKTVESLDVDAFGNLLEPARLLREEIRGLARELPFTHKELANIAAFGGQFGVEATELFKFTEVIAKLGTAVDGIDSETAAKGLAQIVKITGGSMSNDLERLSSELVHLGNTGISTEGTILEITRRMSGAGNVAGMSAKFMMGLSAAVANLGHRAELGGTAIANTILKIDRAVSRGGEALEKFAKLSGKSAKDFAEGWSQSSEKEFMGIFEKLRQLPQQQVSRTVADLFGTAARQTSVILSLVSAHAAMVQTIKDGEEAFRKNNALQEEFRKKATTLWNQLQVLKNQLVDIALTFGGPFLDALRNNFSQLTPLVEVLKKMAQAFEDASPQMQSFVVWSTMLASTLPLVAVAISAVTYTFGQLWSVIAGVLSIFGSSAITSTFSATSTSIVTGMLSAEKAVASFSARLLSLPATLPGFWAAFDSISKTIWTFVDRVAALKIVDMVSASLEGFSAAFAGLGVAIASAVAGTGMMLFLTDFRDFLNFLGVAPKTPIKETETTLQSFANVLRDLSSALKEVYGSWTVFSPILNQFRLANSIGTRLSRYGLMPNIADIDANSRHEKGVDNPFLFDKYSPKTNDQINLASIQKYKTELILTNDLVDKNNESTNTFYRSLSAQMEEASEKTKKVAEAQKLINENFQKSADFEKIFGFDDFEKFGVMLQQYEQMAEMGLQAPESFKKSLEEAAHGAREYLKASHGILVVPEKMNELANAYGATAASISLNSAKIGISNDKIFKDTETAITNITKLGKDLRNVKFDQYIAQQTQSSIGKVLTLVKEWKNAQDGLEEMPKGVDPKVWKEFVDTTNKINIEKIGRAVRETSIFANYLRVLNMVSPAAAKSVQGFFDALGGTERDKKDPVEKIKNFGDEYKKTINGMASAFSKLSNIMGDSFDGSIKSIGTLIGFMNVGAEVGQDLGESWDLFSKGRKGGDGAVANMVQGMMGLVVGLTQAIALMNKATDVAGKFNRIAQGAMTGFSMGMATGNPYIAVGGAIVGAIWGAVRKVGWEEIGKRIGSRTGLEISEQMARTIENTAKTRFASGGDKGWLQAETYHLQDLIEQARGVTTENFGTFARMMRDAFSLFAEGKFRAQDVMHVLDSFTEFIEAGTDRMGFLNKQLREVITLTYQSGVQSKSVLDYMTQQSSVLLDQIEILAQMPAKYEVWMKIQEDIDAANKAIADSADDASKLAEANDDLAKALARQAAEAEIAQQELHDLGIVIAGNVFAATIDGKSLSQAILESKDGLVKFFDAYKALGMVPDDPLVQFLYNQTELVRNIPNTIGGVNALGQSLTGLFNMNLLTTDSFASIQRAGYNAYVGIQAEVEKMGGSTRDALIPMQDYLQRAEKAARELGIPLDENTQMMIDQSKELGIWKELGPTAMEQMTSAMNTLIDRISTLIDKMFGIPSELPNPFRNWYVPKIGDPSEAIVEPEEGRRTGSLGMTGKFFENWGSGTNVTLHGTEAVVTPSQAVPFAASVFEEAYGGGGIGSRNGSPQPVILRVKNKDIFTELALEGADGFLASRGVRR